MVHIWLKIWQTGEICLDILKTAWSPAWTLQSVCRAVIALLAHPEADSPLNCDAGIDCSSILSCFLMIINEQVVLKFSADICFDICLQRTRKSYAMNSNVDQTCVDNCLEEV